MKLSGSFFRNLGPGLLLAATSIGASHLVMAPKAGQMFGFKLLWLVLVTHLFKYHAFEFGPRYAAATGESLIKGYMRLPGPKGWALWIFLLGTIAQGIAVLAGVVGIAAAVLHTFVGHFSYGFYSGAVIISIFIFLLLGGYGCLDVLNKIMMGALLVATVAVFVPVFRKPEVFAGLIKPGIPAGSVALIAAILGWMPTGIDVSIWHSLWTLEKYPQLRSDGGGAGAAGRLSILRMSLADMRVGYVLSFVVASVFLMLSAVYLYGTGNEIEGVGFSKSLADIYVKNIGPWMLPVFMVAAFFAMYSTSYTVMDGFSRSFARTVAVLFPELEDKWHIRLYRGFVVFIASLAFFIIITVGKPVLLVTIVALVSLSVAPLYYVLNYYCVTHFISESQFKPGTFARLTALGGIAIMFIATVLFIGVTVDQLLTRPKEPSPIAMGCRLVDCIDATEESTHNFRDDGKSRVLDLPSGRFRVTSAAEGFELSWFAYDIKTADKAGVPHLLVVELSNDAERYTTITLTVPKGTPWSPPYAGQEKVKLDAMDFTQEPLWYEPDVGADIYTGRELSTDDKPFTKQFIFYPKTAVMKLTISTSGWARPNAPESGAAVSRIWVYEITESLKDHLPKIIPPAEGRQRHFGIYSTHPWYFLAHYGVPPHTVEQRQKSLANMCDTLAFCGMNLIEFNAINGADRAGRAWYPGSYYSGRNENLPDLLAELPPVAARRGIDIIPVVTSITAPGKTDAEAPNEYGFSELSFQKPADPMTDPRAFHNRAPDPLRPEVQQWVIRHLLEIAQRSSDHDNILGVGFRVNGKIGTCYISGEDNSNGSVRVVPAREMGYSSWNLAQFRAATGIETSSDSLAAYKYLQADAARWDKWLDYRCRETHAFWLRARDAVRSVNKDWNLYVLTDLPSEVLATNVQWPGAGEPDVEKITLDLLREHGYDPRMFKADEGIVVQRVMMADADRFFSKWGPPFGSNPLRYRDFHEQDFLADWYRTPAGSAIEVYHNYWEEPYHPDGEFGPNREGFGLRTATATPRDRSFYRSLTCSLRAANNDKIVLMGWERPVLCHEQDLGPFAQAFRSLPVTAPKMLQASPLDALIQAAWYGDRIGVINDTPDDIQITVTLDQPLKEDVRLRDVSTGKVLIDSRGADRKTFTIQADRYSLHTMIMD